MQIFVTSLTRETTSFEVDSSDTIYKVKAKIEAEREYNIRNESTVHMFLNFGSGPKPTEKETETEMETDKETIEQKKSVVRRARANRESYMVDTY
ncbi:hypothetical protein IFM89_007282 [Coptis chinensis]|uniref:Ubiquitin-like domain-containing protein n=1 Tax=Coptis chinensis TaxID=261450 RepID=A0A835ILR3_9MAGN|nr:hypothetical protein IFM89_007282 [Coptis chinensis]